MHSSLPDSVSVRAPAKVNLVLQVGAPDASGYHPLATVFQAVNIWDEVTVTRSDRDRLTVEGDRDLAGVPTDTSNIVWRAVEALEAEGARRTPLHVHVVKRIPVAGGMAGGSADAAATLVAVNRLWGVGADLADLHRLAQPLGADVPFSLLGGLALGEGRGDVLTPLVRTTPLHLVIVKSSTSLSTPTVYRKLDEMRRDGAIPQRTLTLDGFAAIGQKTAGEASSLMVNDLEAPACALWPELVGVLHSVRESGARLAMVSGSGPTVWGLCDSSDHAAAVATRLKETGCDAVSTTSVDGGAEVISRPSSPTAGH